jgi:hypothetical protein
MAKKGRKPILDDVKRREIVAILSVGGTRRMASLYVGCSTSTIQAAALRDPDFAESLRRAEQQAQIAPLRRILEAAQDPKQWRAAAWLLERKNPEEFAARRPNVVPLEKLGALVADLVEAVTVDLPDRYRKSVVKRAMTLAQTLGRQGDPPPAPPHELDTAEATHKAATGGRAPGPADQPG